MYCRSFSNYILIISNHWWTQLESIHDRHGGCFAKINRSLIHHVTNNMQPTPSSNCSKHANHMTLITSGQIMSWPDNLKTKGNVNIKLRDLCETLIVYLLLSTFQLDHMVLTVNKPDVRRIIPLIETAIWKLDIYRKTNSTMSSSVLYKQNMSRI